MSVDNATANAILGGLRPYPVAVTTIAGGRANGLMSLSAGSAGIVPEAPRVTISLTKYNLTNSMVLESGVFAMHILSAEEDMLEKSLAILMGLGGVSGRDGDKMAQFATKPGVTGVPILLDALQYVEGKVVHTLDTEESHIFVADVVAAEQLHTGARLHINQAWKSLPPEWIEQYNNNHHAQTNSARRERGLPEVHE